MRTVFSLGMLSQALKDLRSGQTVDIDGDALGMLFPSGEAGIIDDETWIAARKFALDHKCKFSFNEQTGRSTFSKE
jgi:hypothetical protein